MARVDEKANFWEDGYFSSAFLEAGFLGFLNSDRLTWIVCQVQPTDLIKEA
jgi:hypothetical protein